jgi:hypothetical protein
MCFANGTFTCTIEILPDESLDIMVEAIIRICFGAGCECDEDETQWIMNMNMYLEVQAGTSMTEVVRYFREKIEWGFH